MSNQAREEFLAFMHAMEKDPGHVRHVARLALRLFDDVAPLHGLAERDRLLLEAAACLHDIGHRTEAPGVEHHKESARHIRRRAWRHFDAGEVELIAQIARYHRGSLPLPRHKPFEALSAEDRRKVQQLAALLRLADGLDRRHAQFVAQVAAEVLPDCIVLRLETSEIASEEIVAATRKADLAEAVFQRKIEFKAELTSA